jgi:hypothetical protein
MGRSYKSAVWLEPIYGVCWICNKDAVPLERSRSQVADYYKDGGLETGLLVA